MEYHDVDCHSYLMCNWFNLRYQNKVMMSAAEIWKCQAFLRMPNLIIEKCKVSMQLEMNTEDSCLKWLLWFYAIFYRPSWNWHIRIHIKKCRSNLIGLFRFSSTVLQFHRPMLLFVFCIGSVKKKMSFWYDICTAKFSVPTSGSKIPLASQDTVSADLKKIRLENFARIFTPKRFPYWPTYSVHKIPQRSLFHHQCFAFTSPPKPKPNS